LNPVPTEVGAFCTIFKIVGAYFRNKEERTPKRSLGPFHTDSRVYVTSPRTGLRVTWFGHSTTLIEIDGMRVLTDPVWEQRAFPVEWAGPKRFFPPPLALIEVPPVDVVLVSHDHYDHLGANTVRSLARMEKQANALWVATPGVGRILQNLGVKPKNIRELDWTDNLKLPNLTVTALPARHFSGRGALNRFHTLWASFVLAGPEHRVYFGGDSGEWPGFVEIGQEHGPFDLAMLEIGAYDPLWANIHSGPDGAARNFRALGSTGLLMPIHWGLFDLALHAWRQPIQRLFEIGDLSIWTPVPGKPTDVAPGEQLRPDWWR
jgi:L-ascorbate metabolism protein UlaG (beta-lactamase superfamily)